MSRGYTLVSQEIRGLIYDGQVKVPESNLNQYKKNIFDKIRKGFFVDPNLEARIQPSSFEPSLGGEIFILDTGECGLPRPSRNQSVYRMLLEMPMRHRTKKDLEGGFEVKSGFTYAVKLNERLDLTEKNIRIKSSPKSSIGRLFPVTRLLTDFNPSFDEVHPYQNKDMDMWLLLQPTAFNLVLHPNLTLNQLRFFVDDARLTDREIEREFLKHPLLYEKTPDGKSKPIKLVPGMISEGLKLWLDTQGDSTHGVFGLKARKNPDPIDLSKIGFYSPEKYFEPLVVGRNDTIKRGAHYLFSSREILNIPPHLSAELEAHSGDGIRGEMHRAGFADNGFLGDMVGELTPEEETETAIREMVLSHLEFFRTRKVPDKIYGLEIGSNYHGQMGPRTSKHFKPFDYEYAAKNHAKLSRMVLVQDAKILRSFRGVVEGFEPIKKENAGRLLELAHRGFFHSRYDCEEDDSVLQIIPYTIVFDNKGRVFSYIRTDKKEEYGDKRLFGKHSIGLGGHITLDDSPEYIERCLKREVTEEEVRFLGRHSHPKLVGTLFARDKPVDKVHFGVIYVMNTSGNVVSNEESITYAEFIPLNEMRSGHRGAETETWSRILIPHLSSIYRMSRD